MKDCSGSSQSTVVGGWVFQEKSGRRERQKPLTDFKVPKHYSACFIEEEAEAQRS
jgi:hypothetical protein